MNIKKVLLLSNNTFPFYRVITFTSIRCHVITQALNYDLLPQEKAKKFMCLYTTSSWKVIIIILCNNIFIKHNLIPFFIFIKYIN